MMNDFYKQVGNLFLTERQIKILSKNDIDLSRFNSNHELIYYLESILNYNQDDELDSVSLELSEMYYYNDINKWSILKKMVKFNIIYVDVL